MYLSPDYLITPKTRQTAQLPALETLFEQGSGAVNEDVLLVSRNLLGVFDGATSLDNQRFANGLTGGLLAARTAAEVFRREDLPLCHLAEKANSAIRAAEQSEGIDMDERHRLWSTSMAVIRMTEGGFEFCQTGDAVILLLLSDGGYRFVTPGVDIDRETLVQWKKSQMSPPTPIHELFAEQIRRVRLEMNCSYGVLNGEPEALSFLNCGTEKLDGVSDILLFTDGLQPLRENPTQEPDWSGFVDLYRVGGLRAVRGQVRGLQRTDPELKKYPRFKLHDDIAAAAVKISPHSHVDGLPHAFL
ncbi:MAG: protein phosphatase 2C domain-containing protein [Desulforhopalus sp.]